MLGLILFALLGLAIGLILYFTLKPKTSPTDLPPLPTDANELDIFGSEFSICTSGSSLGIKGVAQQTFYAGFPLYQNGPRYQSVSWTEVTNECSLDYGSNLNLVYNTWVVSPGDGPGTTKILISNTHTTDQLRLFYMNGWAQLNQ
jgi:hypothetical protein